jgi:hypothetical protein
MVCMEVYCISSFGFPSPCVVVQIYHIIHVHTLQIRPTFTLPHWSPKEPFPRLPSRILPLPGPVYEFLDMPDPFSCPELSKVLCNLLLVNLFPVRSFPGYSPLPDWNSSKIFVDFLPLRSRVRSSKM